MILVIINQFMKIFYYKPIKVIINILGLVEIIINTVIKYHNLSNLIFTSEELLFTLKF